MGVKRWAACLLALCLLIPGLPGRAEIRYRLEVDIANQIVTAYDSGRRDDESIARQMICTTGASGPNATPTGIFCLPEMTYEKERQEWYFFPAYNCYAKWATRIHEGVLFHSVLYSARREGPTRASVNALGSRASHGCVRLREEDARWIALNCPAGTICRIYDDGERDDSLRKKLLQRTFDRTEQSYADYLYPPVILRRGGKGTRVRDLQDRLRALGYYDGASSAKFGGGLERAVMRFQAAMGLEQTGRVEPSLWDRAFAGDAPAGRFVPLSEGMEGPAVRALAGDLRVLRLCGAAGDRFDAEVAGAVREWQLWARQEVTGIATPAQQREIAREAGELAERFEGREYRLEIRREDVSMARVTARDACLYKRPASGATRLRRLEKGADGQVLGQVGAWTKVRCGGSTGYVRTSGLRFYVDHRVYHDYLAAEAPAEQEQNPESKE